MLGGLFRKRNALGNSSENNSISTSQEDVADAYRSSTTTTRDTTQSKEQLQREARQNSARNRADLLKRQSPPKKANNKNPFATEEESDSEEESEAAGPSSAMGYQRTYNDQIAQEEDDEIAALKQKTAQTHESALESTRRSRQRLMQTEAVAYDTMNTLDQQGEQLKKAAYGMDNVKFKAEEAMYHYHELKRLHKFLPWSWKSDKRKKEAYKNIEAQRQAEAARKEEEATYRARRSAREVLHQSREDQQSSPSFASSYFSGQTAAVKTNHTNRADAVEAEIEENLDDISSIVGRLKAAALEMNGELSKQTETVERIGHGTDQANAKVHTLNTKLQKYT